MMSGKIKCEIINSGVIEMKLKTIDNMTNQEFDTILDQVGTHDSDMITAADFMETLWEICSKNVNDVIELTAKLVDDHVEIEAPDGVAVRGNEVILGKQRIIIHWAYS